MNHKIIQTVFFLLLLVGAVVLTVLLVKPFLSALVLAFTLAILFRPLFRYINRGIRDHRSIAAFLTILVILIVVLTPLTFLGIRVFNEGRDFYFSISDEDVLKLAEYLPESFQARAADLSRNLSQYLQQGLVWFLQHVGAIFSSIAGMVFTLFISLIGTYYLLKQGAEFKARLINFSPLSDQFDREIMDRLQRAVSSVIRGVLVVAIVQALLAGIGFAIFGVPNPVLWGTLAMIAALIPGIGTALVMVPAIIYLLATGHLAAGIGLAIWAVLAVGLIDNFLSPLLVGRAAKIHSFFILLSVLGGLALYGPIGFLLGPLIVSFLFALLDIYPILILKNHEGHTHDL